MNFIGKCIHYLSFEDQSLFIKANHSVIILLLLSNLSLTQPVICYLWGVWTRRLVQVQLGCYLLCVTIYLQSTRDKKIHPIFSDHSPFGHFRVTFVNYRLSRDDIIAGSRLSVGWDEQICGTCEKKLTEDWGSGEVAPLQSSWAATISEWQSVYIQQQAKKFMGSSVTTPIWPFQGHFC